LIKFLDLYSQYAEIKPAVDAAIVAVINESAFVGGAHVKTFETQFARYMKAKHCVGVANGTDALEVAIEALKLPLDSEIIVPGNSFIATSEAVTRSGYNVVFADVNQHNYTITSETVAAKLSKRTSAIIAVHLYGHPSHMDDLCNLARTHKLRVIEDCAQAHGAEFGHRRVGTIGDIGTFSFYPGKNLGAYGDAGAITTNDDDVALLCRKIANHGRIAKYDHDMEGRSSRLDGMQAAILSAKLPFLESWTEKRIEIANRYLAEIKSVPDLVLPVREPWARQVYHLFVVRTRRRNELKTFLAERGIESGIHYPIALPNLLAYSHLGQAESCPFSSAAAKSVLSLPIGEHMSNADVDSVIQAVNIFFAA
jgi:dTDP-4-amino-4,6-dideoxygalactose transaminase